MTSHIEPGTSSRRAQLASAGPPGVVVHLVDVDEYIRDALAPLAAPGMELLAHAHLEDFFAAHRAESAGCLIIDARTLGARPLPAEIRCPIILVASSADVAMVVRAMKAGAVDVVEKPLCERKLAAALSEAIEIDRRRRLVESRQAAVNAKFATLSPRERQVMALVTAGKLNKQVGAVLGVSEITVKAHRGSVMRKMGTRSIAELVRMADVIGEALTAALRTCSSLPTRSGGGVDRHGGYSQAQSM
jgi:FixJ family two-component response regulator